MADVERGRLEGAAAAVADKTGADVLAVTTDVSSEVDVETLASRSTETFGAVHLLCNNAGVTLPRWTWEYSLEEWRWVIGVNLLGVVHGIKAFVPRMLEQNDPAHIVNTASVGGLMAFPGLAVYGSTKYGVVGLSETLAHDLAANGAPIGVSVLCPGPTETSFRLHSRALHPEGPKEEVPGEYEGIVRMSPEEVAGRVVQAVQADEFWIFTHPEYNDTLEHRARAMLEGRGPVAPSVA